jgi:hypothetical protein
VVSPPVEEQKPPAQKEPAATSVQQAQQVNDSSQKPSNKEESKITENEEPEVQNKPLATGGKTGSKFDL